jgi:hypothetical protein
MADGRKLTEGDENKNKAAVQKVGNDGTPFRLFP